MVLDWLGRAFRSRYVALLEEEVERLRAENRALINSLLGTAGFPPLEWNEGKSAQAAIPRLRRRSWHQIAALREFGAAAKSEASVPQSGMQPRPLADADRAPPRGPFH